MLYALFWGYRVLKGMWVTKRDYQKYRLQQTHPEKFITYATPMDDLQIHRKEEELLTEAHRLDFVLRGSITSPYATEAKKPASKIYTDETRTIFLIVEGIYGKYVVSFNSFFEDGFWLQTAYPYMMCMQGDTYEINGLKTSFEQAYDFHEDTLNRYRQNHGHALPIRDLQTGIDLLNNIIQRDHPRIVPEVLKHTVRLLLISLIGVLAMIFGLATLILSDFRLGEIFITPGAFFVPTVLFLFVVYKWGQPRMFTTVERRKKKKHGNHPFEDA